MNNSEQIDLNEKFKCPLSDKEMSLNDVTEYFTKRFEQLSKMEEAMTQQKATNGINIGT